MFTSEGIEMLVVNLRELHSIILFLQGRVVEFWDQIRLIMSQTYLHKLAMSVGLILTVERLSYKLVCKC